MNISHLSTSSTLQMVQHEGSMIGLYIRIEVHKRVTGLVIMIVIVCSCQFGVLLLNFLTSLQEIMVNVVDVLRLL